jgi:FlaA1/EpsC-like NDP-sugar epimerase
MVYRSVSDAPKSAENYTFFFILKSFELMVGGEVFVPKIPGMNIRDLARAIGPDCRTVVVGIQTGGTPTR